MITEELILIVPNTGLLIIKLPGLITTFAFIVTVPIVLGGKLIEPGMIFLNVTRLMFVGAAYPLMLPGLIVVTALIMIFIGGCVISIEPG